MDVLTIREATQTLLDQSTVDGARLSLCRNGGTICYSHDLVTFIYVVVNTTSGNFCREGYWFPPAGKFVLNYRTGQVVSGLSSLDLLGS